MFFPEGAVRVHVYGQPVDMRKSFDGLYALTRQALGCDPLSGGKHPANPCCRFRQAQTAGCQRCGSNSPILL